VYAYDGDGRRVKKTVNSGTPTVYVYDAMGELVAEYGTFPDAAGTQYLFADHLGSTRLVTDASSAVVSRHDYQPFGEEIGPDIGGRSGVTGYGAADGIAQKFTGKERDPELLATGTPLDYFGARYFSSDMGRFTTPDEFAGGPVDASGGDPTQPGPLPYADIANPQSLNKYSYTYNSPLPYRDPDGHIVDTLLDIGFIIWDLHDLVKHPSRENATALGLDVVGAAIPFATGLGKGFKLAKALEQARRLQEARRLGKEGELTAGIARNTERIVSLTGTAAFRVPDEITKSAIREVKNVKELALTNQIKDLLLYAQKEGKQLTVVVRKDTNLTKPLQELVEKGTVRLEYLK
jgi:RHS repeat-associated protein